MTDNIETTDDRYDSMVGNDDPASPVIDAIAQWNISHLMKAIILIGMARTEFAWAVEDGEHDHVPFAEFAQEAEGSIDSVLSNIYNHGE